MNRRSFFKSLLGALFAAPIAKAAAASCPQTNTFGRAGLIVQQPWDDGGPLVLNEEVGTYYPGRRRPTFTVCSR